MNVYVDYENSRYLALEGFPSYEVGMIIQNYSYLYGKQYRCVDIKGNKAYFITESI